jgi:transposase
LSAGYPFRHWSVASSRTVLANRVLKVRQDTCVIPASGGALEYFVLELADWVNVVPVTSARELVMVTQYRHATRGVTLEIPAGSVKENEVPADAARRELLEETGFWFTSEHGSATRATRKQYSAEEKIRIVLDGLRGEHSIAELCRREGIAESLYYSWSKEFLEAGKRRLAGDTARAATSDEVKDLRREARELKEVVAEQALELRLLKKSLIADGGGEE